MNSLNYFDEFAAMLDEDKDTLVPDSDEFANKEFAAIFIIEDEVAITKEDDIHVSRTILRWRTTRQPIRYFH